MITTWPLKAATKLLTPIQERMTRSLRTAPVFALTLSRPKNFWRAAIVWAESGLEPLALVAADSEHRMPSTAADRTDLRMWFPLSRPRFRSRGSDASQAATRRHARMNCSRSVRYHRASDESLALVRDRGERLVARRRRVRRAARHGLLPRPGGRAAHARRRARRVPAAHFPRSPSRARRQPHRSRRLADQRLRDGFQRDPAPCPRPRRRIAPRHAQRHGVGRLRVDRLACGM